MPNVFIATIKQQNNKIKKHPRVTAEEYLKSTTRQSDNYAKSLNKKIKAQNAYAKKVSKPKAR